MALSSSLEARSVYLPFAHRMGSEVNVVSIDHCYAKPWSTHPEASNARPVRLLFMEPLPRQSNIDKRRDETSIVDVEVLDKPAMPDYDLANSRSMMSECERHAILLRPSIAENKDDWEEHIATLRTTWSVLQNRLFAKVMRVLQSDRLARLTIQETPNEPIQRRLQIDKAAERVKFAFANVTWDMPLILWLHNTFLENLRGQLLTSYLEILQTLRVKIPSLIEKLIEGTECKPGNLTTDSLNVLLNRTWDPVLSSINQQKPKKLPGQALLLLISNVPSMTNALATKRHKFWQHQLSSMGKVVNIVPVNNSSSIPIASCVENMVATTRSKILEVKGHLPGRPIVLVGFHIGSLVACQVALMEQVQAIVCLGYPTMGVHGNRGEIDDPVYNCKTPTLFVVGQHASSCSVDALEDIREKLRVDSGLIIVGGADDHLRMVRAKKKNCGVTQSVVDRCVIDEVSNFLGNTLQLEVSSDSLDDVDIVKKASRKRKKMAVAVAVGSQTSGDLVNQVRMEKKSAKALKSLKQDPMLSSVSSAMDGKLLSVAPMSSKQPVPKLTKTGKRASPKKSKSSDSEIPMKRPMMQMNYKSKKSMGQSSLSRRNEAAAIASAPELSNLLQSNLSMFTCAQPQSTSLPSTTTAPTIVSTLSPSVNPPAPQTTTAQALSKLLQSSDINMMLNSSPPTLSTLDSKRTIDNSSAVKSTPTIMAHNPSPTSTSVESNPNKKQEATQILIHTRDSPIPISFPVTFTMASKVLKTSVAATMKASAVSGSAATASHSIPSFSIDTNRSKLAQMASPLQQTANILQAGQNPASSALSSIFQCAASSSPNTNESSLFKDSIGMAPAATSTKSPLASVINMGSDTVQMKETLTSASDPGTVSIDLGQLSTSNNIVMKFGNPSKISLIPSVKPLSSTSLLGTESKSGMTIAGLLTQAKTTTTAVTSAYTSSVITTVETKPATVSTVSMGKSSEKNLTILSSSDLLSSLSSNSGLITLKLSSPAHSTGGITLTTQKPTRTVRSKSDTSGGILKVLSMDRAVGVIPQRSVADKSEGNEEIRKVVPVEKLVGVTPQKPVLDKREGNEGVLKVLPIEKPTATTPHRPGIDRNEGNEGVLKALPVEKPGGIFPLPKNVTAMSFNPGSTVTVNTTKVVSKPLLSQHVQKTRKEDTPFSDPKSMPTSMSVIFATTTAKSGITTIASPSSCGHLTLQSTARGIPSTAYKTVLVSSHSADSSETLGKITSLLESSPVTVQQPKPASLSTTHHTIPSSDTVVDTPKLKPGGKSGPLSPSSSAASSSSSSSSTPPHTSLNRASKSTVSSYTSTTKNVLPTVASTRTRRIKTPKQYDL